MTAKFNHCWPLACITLHEICLFTALDARSELDWQWERCYLGDWKYLKRHSGDLGGINTNSSQNRFGASLNYYVRFCTEHHPEFWHISINHRNHHSTTSIHIQYTYTNKSSTHILKHLNKMFISYGLQPTIFKTVNTSTLHRSTGDHGSAVVKVLCYKSEGHWFDPSWFQWIFHRHKIPLISLWPWGRLSL